MHKREGHLREVEVEAGRRRRQRRRRRRRSRTGICFSLLAALNAATPFDISWKTRERIGAGIGSPPHLWRVVTFRLIRETWACTLSGTVIMKSRSAASNVTLQSSGFIALPSATLLADSARRRVVGSARSVLG